MVSSHNPEKSRAFRSRFKAEIVQVNQQVIDVSDAIFVAVRPAQVEAALAGLNWRDGQLMISAMAGVKIAVLQELAPAATIVRTMPISSSALLASPTSYFPEHATVYQLLSQIGVGILMQSEEEFEAASTNGAAYGWYFALIDEMVQANQRAGLSKEQAKKVTVETLASAAKVALASERSGGEILRSLATPGGVTALGLKVLEEEKAMLPWSKAFHAVTMRLKGESSQ